MASNSIVILNYNDAERTIKLVNTIKGYRNISNIVVVDNCSTDGSYNKLLELAEGKVDVISSPVNSGYASGNNLGAFYAINKYDPDYIYIANPDVLFEDDVLPKMENALNSSDKYALCGVVVNQKYNVWNRPGYAAIIESLFLIWFNIHRAIIRKRLLKGNCIEEVGVIGGSFFCIKSSVFRQIGGFDENTFLYEEENILSVKLFNNGYKEIILTQERYDHLHSASIKKAYSSKARAFKLFYPSLKYFNKAYLKTNKLQNIFFDICYGLGYFERMIYDVVFRLKDKLKK